MKSYGLDIYDWPGCCEWFSHKRVISRHRVNMIELLHGNYLFCKSYYYNRVTISHKAIRVFHRNFIITFSNKNMFCNSNWIIRFVLKKYIWKASLFWSSTNKIYQKCKNLQITNCANVKQNKPDRRYYYFILRRDQKWWNFDRSTFERKAKNGKRTIT